MLLIVGGSGGGVAFLAGPPPPRYPGGPPAWAVALHFRGRAPAEIQALEADRGGWLGYVRVVGRRRPDAPPVDQVVSVDPTQIHESAVAPRLRLIASGRDGWSTRVATAAEVAGSTSRPTSRRR